MQLIIGSSLPAGDIYQQVGYEDFSSFTGPLPLITAILLPITAPLSGYL